MLYRLGRGLSPAYLQQIGLDVTDILFFTAGQSLQNEKFSQFSAAGEAAFEATGDTLFNSTDLLNGAVGGYETPWNSSLFSGRGGLSLHDASTRLLYTGYSTGATHSFGLVLKNPAAIPGSSSNLLAFSNSGAATDNQARISMANDGRYYYVLDESSSSAAISPAYGGGEEILLLLEFANADTLNVYIDNWSNPAYTINPRDDFINWDSMTIGARSNSDDALLASFGAYFHVTDTLSSTERADIQSYWKARFSIS